MRPSTALQITAQALLAAALLAGLYLWVFGWASPWRFDLQWDEEVQLHDQRIIVVTLRRTYERSKLLSSSGSVRLATAISFDAGAPFGHFSHQFGPEDVALIDQDRQVWYVVAAPLQTSAGTGQDGLVFWTLRPGKALQQATSAEKLPESFTRWNVMPAMPDAALLARFDHTRLGLAEKMRHWSAYPRPDGAEVMRLGPRDADAAARR